MGGDGGSVPSYHGIDDGAAEDDAEGDAEVGVSDCALWWAFGRCGCGRRWSLGSRVYEGLWWCCGRVRSSIGGFTIGMSVPSTLEQLGGS